MFIPVPVIVGVLSFLAGMVTMVIIGIVAGNRQKATDQNGEQDG